MSLGRCSEFIHERHQNQNSMMLVLVCCVFLYVIQDTYINPTGSKRGRPRKEDDQPPPLIDDCTQSDMPFMRIVIYLSLSLSLSLSLLYFLQQLPRQRPHHLFRIQQAKGGGRVQLRVCQGHSAVMIPCRACRILVMTCHH